MHNPLEAYVQTAGNSKLAQCLHAALSEVGEVPVPHGGVKGHADDVVVRRLQPRDAVRVALQLL